MQSYLLVGGWPGSNKSTLSRALAHALGRPYLAKDELKEALMDGLGPRPSRSHDAWGRPPSPSCSGWRAASLETVRQRYRARRRGAGHLDQLRDEAELWSAPVRPLGVGPLLEVDTERDVDVAALVEAVHRLDENGRQPPREVPSPGQSQRRRRKTAYRITPHASMASRASG